MKILSLHAKFSSFFSICFCELVDNYDVEIRMVCSKPSSTAPFSDDIYINSKVRDWCYREDLGLKGIMQRIEEYQPDVILTSGWMFREYLKACRSFRKKGGLVIAFSDTQFQNRWKQKMGCLLAPWLLHPAIDIICVAGERQRQYASLLGYRTDSIIEPMLCCNWSAFDQKRLPPEKRSSKFIYVGRMVESKGAFLLLEAYTQYRNLVKNPWNLEYIGGGGDAEKRKSYEGVTYKGFVQPEDLPEAMADAGCFVLPSLFDPWGVVLQEAATLGLPLIASEACGAAVHLLRDGWNGSLTETANPESLCRALLQIHNSSSEELSKMGERSHLLSRQFTPDRWAKTIYTAIVGQQS